MNVREKALKTLYEICFGGAYSNIAVKEALGGGELSPRDKDLFSRIVYGTLDKEITLDHIIGTLSSIRLKKISRYILIILRMGIYQIKYMDKIPDSAAVNESVKLARKYGNKGSVGFVNAVLRNAARTETEYPEDGIEFLSVRYSFPADWCEKWVNDFGYNFTKELMSALEKPRPLILRPNTLRTTAEELCEMLSQRGIEASVQGGAVICSGFDIASDELYRNGFYTVQDAAAMESAIHLAPKAGETVIDMCAAPGGKTTHMAELMENRGSILAFDIYPHKVELIRKNAKRLGIDIIEAKEGDASKFNAELEGIADKVLCDVPCRGTGIVGRKPDIKRNRRADRDITALQRTILDNAARYLKKGGSVLYSTCSLEGEENGGVTGAFLRDNGSFERIYEKTYYPNIDDTDGFYVCLMRKND